MSFHVVNKSDGSYVYEELRELTRVAKQEMVTIKTLLLTGNQEYALAKMEKLDHMLSNEKLINTDDIDKQVPTFFSVKYLIYMRIQLSKKIKALRADLGLESVSECQDNDFNNTIGTSDSFDVVYFCDSAKRYSILSNEIVEEFSQPEMLCIVAERAKIDLSESERYLLFGNVRFPLPPDVVIYIHLQLKAFMFKVDNLSCEVNVGFSVHPHDLDVLCMTLEDLKFNIYKTESVQHTEEVGKEDNIYVKTISWGLVEGAGHISSGLVNMASGISNLISKATPKLIDTITPESEANVPEGVVIGTEVTKNVCNTLANATGYFATQMSTAVSNLGNALAPHVKQQSTSLLKYCGMNEQCADEYVSGSLEVAGGAVEGFRMIVEGLHKSGTILYSSLTSNTVQIVKHKYGEPVSQVTANTLDSLGSLVAASSNMKSLTPKSVIMKSIKETGKAVALQDYPKDSNTSVVS